MPHSNTHTRMRRYYVICVYYTIYYAIFYSFSQLAWLVFISFASSYTVARALASKRASEYKAQCFVFALLLYSFTGTYIFYWNLFIGRIEWALSRARDRWWDASALVVVVRESEEANEWRRDNAKEITRTNNNNNDHSEKNDSLQPFASHISSWTREINRRECLYVFILSLLFLLLRFGRLFRVSHIYVRSSLVRE